MILLITVFSEHHDLIIETIYNFMDSYISITSLFNVSVLDCET